MFNRCLQVGLLGLLLKKFRAVLFVHPCYLGITVVLGFIMFILYIIDNVPQIFIMCLGAYRVRHFNANGTLNELWKDNNFIAISIIQKCGTYFFRILLLDGFIALLY